MSTEYRDAVLADTPALYYRVDMVGGASDGDPVPDSSVSGLNGSVVFLNSPTEPYGYASPIETDASSKSFYGNNSTSGSLPRAAILRASSALIEPAGDLCLEGWWMLPTGAPGASHSPQIYFGKGSGNPILPLTNSFFLGTNFANDRFVGGLYDSAGTLWTVTSTTAISLDTFYHLAVVRLGNALSLYVNKQLQGTTLITSGLPTNVTSDTFFIHCPQTADMAAYYDEIALYTHALTATRIRAHYDAARFAQQISARLSIRSTFTVDTTQEDLIDFPFAHNFADPFGDGQVPISERLSYFTDVIPSRTDYEQRITLRAHGPSRTLNYQITPSSTRQKAMLNALTFKPAQTYLIPISSDRTPLTSDATTGDSTIELDTIGRDFEPGSRLRLGTWDDSETCVIDSVTDTDVTITGTLANDWPAGTSVVPIRKARIIKNQIKSHAADHESDMLEFQIVSSELSDNRAADFTPALTYRDEEIFNLEKVRVTWLDEIAIQDIRRVNTLDNKTGAFEQFSGDTGTARSTSARLLYSARSGMADFFGWLAVRQGQSTPLWIPSLENDFQAVSKVGSTLTIESIGYSQYYNLHSARRDVCFVLNDGTFTNRRITASVDNGDGTETLTFDASVPTLATVNRISWLKYCRLQGDEIELDWHRASSQGSTILTCTVGFRELLTSPS
jgi:hypothetical protein